MKLSSNSTWHWSHAEKVDMERQRKPEKEWIYFIAGVFISSSIWSLQALDPHWPLEGWSEGQGFQHGHRLHNGSGVLLGGNFVVQHLNTWELEQSNHWAWTYLMVFRRPLDPLINLKLGSWTVPVEHFLSGSFTRQTAYLRGLVEWASHTASTFEAVFSNTAWSPWAVFSWRLGLVNQCRGGFYVLGLVQMNL